METSQTLPILQTLISESCSDMEANNSIRHEQLYAALLKKFFRAATVAFDYVDGNVRISLKARLSDTDSQDIQLELETGKLADFLSSCIQRDANHARFYTNLLQYYAVRPLVTGEDI